MVYCFSHITVHGSSQIRPSPVWIWHFHSRKQSQNEGSIESLRDMRVPMMANPNFSLVGGLEHFFYFMTFHMLGMSSSQLTNSIIFQRGRLNHQPAADCISKSGPIPSPDSNHGFTLWPDRKIGTRLAPYMWANFIQNGLMLW